MANDVKEIQCTLLVIGAGPGGYVCAIRAGQQGVDTVIVEQGKSGGTCLNVGCIPSKALIHTADKYYSLLKASRGDSAIGLSAAKPGLSMPKAVAWKDSIVKRLNQGVDALLKKARVKSVAGSARFLDGKTVEVAGPDGVMRIRSKAIVIATGSVPVELPSMPFGRDVISSTEALSLEEIPKTLAVVGGGYIGLELGSAFAKLGSKVTIVEAGKSILPSYDEELTKPVHTNLIDLGVDILLGAEVQTFDSKSGKLSITNADKENIELSADKVLVTVGRKPVTDGWGAENLLLDMEGRFIKIDERCETTMSNVYAIGDVTGEPMLAHRAMAQGEMVAEIVAGRKREWDKYCIPAVCFTDPEIVSVGVSPKEAEKNNMEIVIGKFPFQANGRAMTTGRDDGFIRVVARSDNHLIIGIQAVGVGISELSTSFGLAIEMGARLEDVAQTIHAHPTQGEAFQESCMNALGMSLHM